MPFPCLAAGLWYWAEWTVPQGLIAQECEDTSVPETAPSHEALTEKRRSPG
jgi:hypothetical protein